MKITVQIFTPPRYLLSGQGVTAQHMNLSETLDYGSMEGKCCSITPSHPIPG